MQTNTIILITVDLKPVWLKLWVQEGHNINVIMCTYQFHMSRVGWGHLFCLSDVTVFLGNISISIIT